MAPPTIRVTGPKVPLKAWKAPAVALCAVLLFFALVAIVQISADLLVPDDGLTPAEAVVATNNARGSVIQLLAGVTLIAGAVFTARTYLLNRHTNRTDRFAKAVTNLGDDSPSVRTGGVLSLWNLARESPGYWPSIEEMLASFIRERAASTKTTQAAAATARPDNDVQVALRVLGKRPHARIELHGEPLDLGFLNLADADLTGANLEKVRLDGSSLFGAKLSDARLNGASLRSARLEFADLASADLTYADIRGAALDGSSFYEATTTGTKASGCDLSKVRDLTDEQRALLDLSTRPT